MRISFRVADVCIPPQPGRATVLRRLGCADDKVASLMAMYEAPAAPAALPKQGGGSAGQAVLATAGALLVAGDIAAHSGHGSKE